MSTSGSRAAKADAEGGPGGRPVARSRGHWNCGGPARPARGGGGALRLAESSAGSACALSVGVRTTGSKRCRSHETRDAISGFFVPRFMRSAFFRSSGPDADARSAGLFGGRFGRPEPLATATGRSCRSVAVPVTPEAMPPVGHLDRLLVPWLRGALMYSSPRSRLMISTPGWAFSHVAKESAERSGSRSTGRRRSRSQRIVP